MGTGAGTGTTAGTRITADDDRIAALRRRVYGPDASPADVAALAAVLAAVAPAPAPTVPEPVAEPALAHPGAQEPAPEPGTLARAAALLRRVPPRLAAVAVGVAVVGALAGAGAAALAAGTGPAAAPSVPRFVPALTVATTPGVLAGAAGHPAALVGPDLVSRTFRRLAAYPAAGVTLWAAKDRFGQTCLVVADTYYRTACADPATFAKDGLVVVWSGGPGYPVSTTESYTAVWRHGRLTAGRTAS